MNPMSVNKERDLANKYIEETKRHVFLTGRAGSGKTTLLKEIISSNKKNTVVVAPTGVAAINAGGVTIHSLLQLPFTAFAPTSQPVDPDIFMNTSMLLSQLKISKEKRAVIQAMDLLIIDEISMVRPDLLDAVDLVLRKIRKNRSPFGDVQVLMVGDLYQLPPVVKDHEWSILKNIYQTPYFFSALVWQKVKLIPIELKKIYRQTDQQFVDILNKVREGKVEEKDIAVLNKRFLPASKETEDAIMLTTHNKTADQLNAKKLKALKGKPFKLEAQITGKFFESSYPCESDLSLKKDAQVMFIKNDKDKRYYNGKLATIVRYDREEEEVIVRFHDEGGLHQIQREEWANEIFEVDEETQEISKKELGSFKQFPFRLAWAVTVHKSQGLTMDKVQLDLGRSFAAGQAYVALSRCTSLEGIRLNSLLNLNNVIIDHRIQKFYSHFPETEAVEGQLEEAIKEYALYKLKKTFNFYAMQNAYENWKMYYESKSISGQDNIILLDKKVTDQINILSSTAGDFQQHLTIWIEESLNDTERLAHILFKTEKAIPYFTNILHNKVILLLHEHLQDFQAKSKIKKYLSLTMAFYDAAWKKMEELYAIEVFERKLFQDKPYKKGDLPSLKTAEKQLVKKGGTYEITYEMFKVGMTYKQIAKKREMAISTIEGHMARHLENGRVSIHDLIKPARLKVLTELLEDQDLDSLSELRNRLPKKVSFGELRMMKIYLNSLG